MVDAWVKRLKAEVAQVTADQCGDLPQNYGRKLRKEVLMAAIGWLVVILLALVPFVLIVALFLKASQEN